MCRPPVSSMHKNPGPVSTEKQTSKYPVHKMVNARFIVRQYRGRTHEIQPQSDAAVVGSVRRSPKGTHHVCSPILPFSLAK